LPPFAQFEADAGIRQRWKPVAAELGWHFDGHRFEPISLVSRGDLKQRPGPEVPAPFREVCEYLAKLPRIEVIQAIAFPVRPKG
jgi:hypothetical protein